MLLYKAFSKSQARPADPADLLPSRCFGAIAPLQRHSLWPATSPPCNTTVSSPACTNNLRKNQHQTLFGFEADATALVPDMFSLGFEDDYEELEADLQDFSEKFADSPAAQVCFFPLVVSLVLLRGLSGAVSSAFGFWLAFHLWCSSSGERRCCLVLISLRTRFVISVASRA